MLEYKFEFLEPVDISKYQTDGYAEEADRNTNRWYRTVVNVIHPIQLMVSIVIIMYYLYSVYVIVSEK